jgi:hypothetical protein
LTQTFTLSRSDVASFQKQVGKVLRRAVPRSEGFLLSVAAGVCIGLALFTYLRLYDTAYEYRRSLATVGGLIFLAAVAFLLARAVFARRVRKSFIRDNGWLLSPQTITIDEEGIALITLQGLGSSRFAWAAFIGRTEDERNVYLFLELSYGIIVPKNAIAGPDQELTRQRVHEL